MKIRGDDRDRHRRRPGRDEVFFAVAEDDWSLLSESCSLLAPLELGTVDPDAMQKDRELAGDSGLRPQTRRAPLFRAAQFKKIWRRGRPAKQQVAVDRLSVAGEAGTTKRNAYPYAAYGAPAQRDCKLQPLAHASLEGLSNWAWGAKRNNDARPGVCHQTHDQIGPKKLATVPAHPVINSQ